MSGSLDSNHAKALDISRDIFQGEYKTVSFPVGGLQCVIISMASHENMFLKLFSPDSRPDIVQYPV